MIAGHMEPGFRPPQTVATAPSDDLLGLVSELIDAHIGTIQLITGEERTELEWLAHCDYLRALQRLGRETLAHHDQRTRTPPLDIVTEMTIALARAWTTTLVTLRIRAGEIAGRWPARPALSAARSQVHCRVA
jgi:hypothetical protein